MSVSDFLRGRSVLPACGSNEPAAQAEDVWEELTCAQCKEASRTRAEGHCPSHALFAQAALPVPLFPGCQLLCPPCALAALGGGQCALC